MDQKIFTHSSPCFGHGQYYPSRSPLSNDKKSSRPWPPHPNKILKFFDDILDFENLLCFGSTWHMRGGGRRRSVGYITRVSPKTIPRTGKDCRSLSRTILDIYIFFSWSNGSDVAWILALNLTCPNFTKKLPGVSHFFGPQKVGIWTEKKNSSTLLYENLPLCKILLKLPLFNIEKLNLLFL